uniref:Uncharacterized protein n=1 Tax=viral metagenome TaxID=1070528 RepID=A0A6H1ZGX9_9ZZZZ
MNPKIWPQGVAGGNSHDHAGGDGAQIDHTTLSNIGSDTHTTIDSHIDDATLHFTRISTFQAATALTGSFAGFTTTETITANIASAGSNNPVIRAIRAWISNDPGADQNINFRLSLYNSDSMTEDELMADFFFNLTYTEVKTAEWAASGTGGDVDSTAGLVKYDLVRLMGGTAENVRISAVTDSDTLAVSTLVGAHAVDSGVVRIAEISGNIQLLDADGTSEIHAKLETLSAPNASMNVAIAIDVQ